MCLDLFDTASTLAAYCDGLLMAYTLDALGARAPRFDQADADAFLTRILAADVTETVVPIRPARWRRQSGGVEV